MGKGGGGGGDQESRVYQSSLPEYAQPYYERLMQRAEGVTSLPYEAYTEPRISGFSGDTLSAQQGIRDLATYGTPGADTGFGYTDTATQNAFGLNYNPNAISTGYNPTAFGYNQVAPNAQLNGGIFNNAAAQFYMSPYMQNVVDVQRQNAYTDFARQQLDRNASYVNAGAFGSNRRAVGDALAAEGLQSNLRQIDASGYQSAWEQAQQQFERDRAAGLQAGQFNVSSAMQGDLANQAANLQAQQLSDASRQFGTTAGMEAQRLNEANLQAAMQLGLAQSELGMQGASQLANLDASRQQQLLEQQRNLAAVGQDIQNQEQRQLDLAYQDYINQRDFERQQIAYMGGIMHGVPVSPQAEILYQTQTNPTSQIIGLGLGGIGLASALGVGQE